MRKQTSSQRSMIDTLLYIEKQKQWWQTYHQKQRAQKEGEQHDKREERKKKNHPKIIYPEKKINNPSNYLPKLFAELP